MNERLPPPRLGRILRRRPGIRQNARTMLTNGRRTLPVELSVQISKSAEQKRLDEAREQEVPWKQWGPYLSERQWGTVREDYSEDGDAWNYFTHDQARSRAYHWGEDGLAGISDDSPAAVLRAGALERQGSDP